ncbi:MAG: 40S ribosomal protein S19 [Candidatus Micrarchaeia archaeon]
MSSVFETPANQAVDKIAQALESNDNIAIPNWYGTVKGGAHKERVPENPKLWYKRAAAVLRTLATGRKVGVRRLQHKFGGRKEHKVRTPHHVKEGGKSIRVAFQQLEKAGFVQKEKTGGRTITPAGASFVEKACGGSEKQAE